MARLLEIKGLGDAVKGIKAEIAGIKSIAGEVNTEAPLLKAELADLRDQIKEHRADLRFEAETLGNGASSKEQSEEEKKQVDKLVGSEEATGSGSSSGSFQAG